MKGHSLLGYGLLTGFLAAPGCTSLLGVTDTPVPEVDASSADGSANDVTVTDSTADGLDENTTGADSGLRLETGAAEAGADGPDAMTDGPGDAHQTDSGSSDSESGSPESGGEAGSAFPSCAGGGDGRDNCGPGEDCCLSLSVPGGVTFDRTYQNTGGGPTNAADPAIVSTFRLDKYDVTVGRFRNFVDAWMGGWKPSPGVGKHSYLNGGAGLVDVMAPADAGTGYEPGWVASDDANLAPTGTNFNGTDCTWAAGVDTKPINCITWAEAYAFCIWDGGFLPTAAEWVMAAAGGTDQREWPWGSTAPGSTNQYAIYNCDYPDSAGSCSGSTAYNFAPVGTASLGSGKYGQLDLTGNVSQWLLDVDFGPNVYRGNPCVDCAELTNPQMWNRDIRGGQCDSNGTAIMSWQTGQAPPTQRYYGNSVRCARAP